MRGALTGALAMVIMTTGASAGCLESTVTSKCEAMAQTQCSRCYACAEGVEGISGAQLCEVAQSSSEAGCVAELVETCESQSNARQMHNDELELCEEALGEGASCRELYELYAQGHKSLPQPCRVLF